MSIGLGDINLINIFLMLRFGLVWFGSVGNMKNANQTKPNHAVEEKSDPNTSKPNALFCGLGWFGLRFFYWIGSVLNTPV